MLPVTVVPVTVVGLAMNAWPAFCAGCCVGNHEFTSTHQPVSPGWRTSGTLGGGGGGAWIFGSDELPGGSGRSSGCGGFCWLWAPAVQALRQRIPRHIIAMRKLFTWSSIDEQI